MKTVTLLLFIVSGLAYICLINNKKVGPFVKVLPAAILAIYSLLSASLLFALIFILAGLGDYLLTRPGKFYWGACAFTVAYSVLNLVTFAHFSPLYLLAVVPFFALFFWFKEGLVRENAFYPFLAYGIVVVAFLVVNAMGHLTCTGRVILGLGLLSLAISDIVIAVRLARPFKYDSYIIMITYYTGLALVSGLI